MSRLGGAGVLFDPHESESIADALVRLASEPDLARVLAARAHARASARSWRQFAEELWAIYGGACEEIGAVFE